VTGVRIRAAAGAVVVLCCLAPGASVAADGDGTVDLGGVEVSGSTDSASPTRLEAGEWSDTLGSPASRKDRHFFSYRRTISESTVHIAVSASGTGASDAVDIVTSAGVARCGSDSSSAWSYSPSAVFGARVSVGPDGFDEGTGREERNSACMNEEIVFEVGRGSTTTDLPDLPVMVKIVEERPLRLPAELELPLDSDPFYAPPATSESPREVTGATTFAGAPALSEGSWSDTLREGEERLYRVHLGWGQGLSLRAEAPAFSGPEAEARYGSGPQVALSILDPLHSDVPSDVDDVDHDGPLTDDDPMELTHAITPVSYLNRYDDRPAYLPGDYYVSIALEPAGENETPVEVPMTLDVEMTDGEGGAPAYDGDPAFLVAPDTLSEVASGEVPPLGDESAGTGRRLAAAGLGVFGLLCCAAGGVVLRGRRVS
jgi:hypothetical protein